MRVVEYTSNLSKNVNEGGKVKKEKQFMGCKKVDIPMGQWLWLSGVYAAHICLIIKELVKKDFAEKWMCVCMTFLVHWQPSLWRKKEIWSQIRTCACDSMALLSYVQLSVRGSEPPNLRCSKNIIFDIINKIQNEEL